MELVEIKNQNQNQIINLLPSDGIMQFNNELIIPSAIREIKKTPFIEANRQEQIKAPT